MSLSELARLQDALRAAPGAHAGLLKELQAAPDAAAMAALLNRHGYAVSAEELQQAGARPGALSEDQLDGVSAGAPGSWSLFDHLFSGQGWR